MIKCTLGQLFSLNDSVGESVIDRVLRLGNDIPSISCKWRISRTFDAVLKAIRPALAPRKEILSKFGIKKDDRVWQIDPNKADEYNTEITVLMSTVVDLLIDPLPITIFEGSKITVGDLISLSNVGLVIDDLSSPLV